MSGDDSGLTDEVIVQINPSGSHDETGLQADPIPIRPADGADKAAWIEYVVSLGADRGFVTGDTEHYDSHEDAMVTTPGLSKPQLADLAARLGG